MLQKCTIPLMLDEIILNAHNSTSSVHSIAFSVLITNFVGIAEVWINGKKLKSIVSDFNVQSFQLYL